eukprot:GHVU01123947.1.p1 GENE.GHVU01123947.1~~GHVU01123947.1.p1  ORF type:complete len:267 (+),score=55.75 GHVU01123947.1:575-1375(+)
MLLRSERCLTHFDSATSQIWAGTGDHHVLDPDAAPVPPSRWRALIRWIPLSSFLTRSSSSSGAGSSAAARSPRSGRSPGAAFHPRSSSSSAAPSGDSVGGPDVAIPYAEPRLTRGLRESELLLSFPAVKKLAQRFVGAVQSGGFESCGGDEEFELECTQGATPNEVVLRAHSVRRYLREKLLPPVTAKHLDSFLWFLHHYEPSCLLFEAPMPELGHATHGLVELRAVKVDKGGQRPSGASLSDRAAVAEAYACRHIKNRIDSVQHL